MWSPRAYLEGCERLKETGFAPEYEPGQRIGRRFADLGYEEFLLIPGDKMISLFTGQASPLPSDHRRFFFLIPSAEEMIQLIQRAGWDVLSLEFPEQRRWELRLSGPGGVTTVRGSRIEDALLEGLAVARSAAR